MTESSDTKEGGLPAPIARKEERQKGWLGALNPSNAARVVKVVGRLVGTTARLSNTVSQTLRENKGRDAISAAVANRIASGIADQDPQFERAFQREAERLLGEQQSLDDIAEIVTEELGTKTEKDFGQGEVEDDWLYQFEQAAKGFTSERMKHTFARLLSGEILRPGSFSPATLRTVATMSTKDAARIVRFLSHAYSPVIDGAPRILSPMLLTGEMNPGNNDLAKFGLSYSDLSSLQQAGFLNYDLSTHRKLNDRLLIGVNSKIGSNIFRFVPYGGNSGPNELQLKGLLLTNVGAEISEIVETTGPDAEYISALRAGMEKRHNLSLIGPLM